MPKPKAGYFTRKKLSDPKNKPFHSLLIDTIDYRIEKTTAANTTTTNTNTNTTTNTTNHLPACSSVPRQLQGRFSPLLEEVALDQVEQELPWVSSGASHFLKQQTAHFADVIHICWRLEFFYSLTGGEWIPKNCSPDHRIALVVPYRNHLFISLDNLDVFLLNGCLTT